MRGFIFTVDALFAAVVGITLALSLFLLLEKAEPQPAISYAARDILAVLDKTGKFESVTGQELADMLSPHNRCGTLLLKNGGTSYREVSACACGSEGEVYSAMRSFVKSSDSGAEEYVAVLKTCLKG